MSATSTKPTMLVIDDDPGSSGLLREVFGQEGYVVTLAASGAEGLAAAAGQAFDIVLCDVQLPDIDGIEVLRRLLGVSPETTVILVTAFGTIETAIQALDQGASDYVRKPFKIEEVRLAVERAVERRRLRDAAKRRQASAGGPGSPPGGTPALGSRRPKARPIVGSHPAMVELFKLVSRVAGTKSSVLVIGESGTGKELIARTIHEASPRRDRPFVAVSCTSLSETLLESELFGHVKGAFTGAIERHPGLFLEANRGTVFLDEVGDMSLAMQMKLLRVLQEQEVKPVGGAETVPVDVRVVAATHRDLEALVREGKFREDLYYRLHVVALHVPPLRERREDIPVLAEHFLSGYATQSDRPIHGFSPKALDALCKYQWPGNVRELENAIERAVALAPGATVEVSDLPERLVLQRPTAAAMESHRDRASLDEMTRRYVLDVLAETGGNKTEAARVLGVPRRTLYRMLERFAQGAPGESVGQGGTVVH